MGETVCHDSVATGHSLGIEHGIQNGPFGGSHHGVVERGDIGIGKHYHRDRERRCLAGFVWCHATVSGRKGEEYVATGVLPHTAHSAYRYSSALGQPSALMRQQRGIGSNHHDDGTGSLRARIRDPR
jgi:hypothetical protein